MFRNALVVVSTLLAIATIPGATACTNNACAAADAIYKTCKAKAHSLAEFKSCLCTRKFLVNYDRCVGGTVCAWDGNPATLNNPCILIYCPGFVNFDAKAYCTGAGPRVPPASLTYSPIPIETGIA